MRWMIATLALAAVLNSRFAAAEGSPVATVAQPRPLERAPPAYPRGELQQRREGWVLVAFVVTREGTVRDAFVEDSSGLKAFEKAALAAVRGWRYAPATVGGEPRESAVTRSKVVFALDPPQDGARAPFVRDYRAAWTHLEAGENAEAQAIIERMERRPKSNLYEDAWYWMLKSLWYQQQGDPGRQLVALRRATAYEGEYLPEALYLTALRTQVLLQATRGEYAAAFETHRRIAGHRFAKDSLRQLEPLMAELQARVDGELVLAVDGVIGAQDEGYRWGHQLVRREFAVERIEGEIRSVELMCEQQVRRLEWAAERAWKLPPAWGRCTIYPEATPGTRLRVLEYPLEPDPAA